jgi:hypothetical protein
MEGSGSEGQNSALRVVEPYWEEALNLRPNFTTATPLFGYKQLIQNLVITPHYIVTFSPQSQSQDLV